MPQFAACSKCGFVFFGGHHHHAGNSPCICLSCLAFFVCPTESEWGPHIGEEIEIYRVTVSGTGKEPEVQHLPTGVKFTVERGQACQRGETVSYDIHYPIDNVLCPNCRSKTLTLEFKEGDCCPMCKDSSLQVSYEVEY